MFGARKISLYFLTAALATFALNACSSGNDAKAPAGSTAAGTTDTQDCVAKAQAVVDEARSAVPPKAPPSKLDTAALKGKQVWVILNVQNDFTSGVMDGAKKAVESLGIELTVVDGKGNANDQNLAVEQAVGQNPDAIVLWAIKADQVQAALEQATKHGTKVTEIFSTLKGAPLPKYVSAAMNLDSAESGRLLGNWILADSGCDARVGLFSNAGVDLHQQMRDAVIDVIDGACEKCRVVAEDIDSANIGTTFGPRVTAVLQREGDLNYLLPTLDSVVPILKTGAAEFDVKIVSHDGLGENLNDIREGGPKSQVADAAFPPTPWIGWALTDLVSRTIVGETPQDWSIPVRIIDATNIGESNDALPAYAKWVNFEDAFRSAWGVK